MRHRFVVLALALTIATPAFADPKDELTAAADEWVAAFSSHDIDRVMALYSKDAVLWGTNSTTLRAMPEDVRAFFQGAFKMPNVQVSYDTQTVRVFGNTGIVAGTYTFSISRGREADTRAARYSFTLVKDDGKWLIVNHNSSPMPSR